MGEYFLWYVATVIISFIAAGILLYSEYKIGNDITLKVFSIAALVVFVPYLNTGLLAVGLVMLIVFFADEGFTWLGEKFDTVVLFKGKSK